MLRNLIFGVANIGKNCSSFQVIKFVFATILIKEWWFSYNEVTINRKVNISEKKDIVCWLKFKSRKLIALWES